MSLPGFASVTPFIIWQGEIKGGFNICLYLALPLSLYSSYGKVRRGVGFNVCLFLVFSVTPIIFHSSWVF